MPSAMSRAFSVGIFPRLHRNVLDDGNKYFTSSSSNSNDERHDGAYSHAMSSRWYRFFLKSRVHEEILARVETTIVPKGKEKPHPSLIVKIKNSSDFKMSHVSYTIEFNPSSNVAIKDVACLPNIKINQHIY